MKNRVTARDVARHVGVSIATVSNVINNINKVSEETKQRVLQAMNELNYQPDFTARTLAKKKSNLIGIMLPVTETDDDASILMKDNPFYGEFISGIEYMAGQKGYDVLLTGVRAGQNCEDWINKRNIDGVIFLGVYHRTFLEKVQHYNVPIVLTDIYEQNYNKCHNIGIDDKGGGEMATNHLIELGHRKIAFATGNIFLSDVNYRRYEGYQAALHKTGIPMRESMIFQDVVSFEAGYRIGQRIMRSSEQITAVFAVADILAFGLIKAFEENNRKVPDDYSIIGFDNLKICEYFSPGLTTIDQNIFHKGVVAAKTLIDDIELKSDVGENIILPIRIVVRKSTKKV